MAAEETHIQIAGELRVRANNLRGTTEEATSLGLDSPHTARIVGYEIAAALHGIAAAGLAIAEELRFFTNRA